MTRKTNSTETTKEMNILISKLSENAILSTEAMSMVRGGEGEDKGGEVIIIIPEV